jgi:hypothetical protein
VVKGAKSALTVAQTGQPLPHRRRHGASNGLRNLPDDAEPFTRAIDSPRQSLFNTLLGGDGGAAPPDYSNKGERFSSS